MSESKNSMFRLRVLLEFDERYKIFVAHCLETGSVITADDKETAREMMKELLVDEVSHAVRFNNLRNLLSSPAPMETWRKWQEAVRGTQPTSEELNFTVSEINVNEPEAELCFASA